MLYSGIDSADGDYIHVWRQGRPRVDSVYGAYVGYGAFGNYGKVGVRMNPKEMPEVVGLGENESSDI